MKIKKDDNVIVISGKDRGKTGKVVKAFPRVDRIIIAGVNVVKSHEKPKKTGAKGQIVEKAMPIHVSNVMRVDSNGKRTRKVEKKSKKAEKAKASKAKA